jgi:hypothetical protein
MLKIFFIFFFKIMRSKSNNAFYILSPFLIVGIKLKKGNSTLTLFPVRFIDESGISINYPGFT